MIYTETASTKDLSAEVIFITCNYKHTRPVHLLRTYVLCQPSSNIGQQIAKLANRIVTMIRCDRLQCLAYCF